MSQSLTHSAPPTACLPACPFQKRMTIESVSRHPWLVGESDEGIEYDAMLSYGE